MFSVGSLWTSSILGKLSWPTRPSRFVAGVETFCLLAMLEWVLWTDNRNVLPKAFRTANAILLAIVVTILLLRQRPTLSQLGIAPSHWLAGSTWLFAMTAVAMVGIAFVGWQLGTLGNVADFTHWISRNWYLEGLQQLLLQVMLVPRLQILFQRRDWVISIIAAILFGLLHLPNFPLTLLTIAAGFVWCEWFRRFPNLIALWISHLLLAGTLLYCANTDTLGTLRVGIAYLYRH